LPPDPKIRPRRARPPSARARPRHIAPGRGRSGRVALEGAAAAASAAVIYHQGAFSWIWFAVFFLAPDLSMFGYLKGPRFGALAYNAAHTYAVALPLALVGLFARQPGLLAAGLIWTPHIGLDRALGYGLKLPTGFRDTHLGPIGRARAL